jgi:hypothetical protein
MNFVNLLLINKLEIYLNKGVENSIPLFLSQIKGHFIYFNPFNFVLLIGFLIFLTIYIWIFYKFVLYLQWIKKKTI